MEIGEFLLARIAEDEAVARKATSGPWRVGEAERNVYESGENANAAVAVGPYGGDVGDSAEHIARHDPARVLAECEAKRRIVEDCQIIEKYRGADEVPTWVLAILALPYAHHPDYRPEWKP